MRIFRALLMVGACVGGCNGTETDNPVETDDGPLVRFENSPCKSHAETTPGQQPLVVSSEAEGLQCISWEPGDDDALLLRLSNFEGPCVTEWAGEATLTEDGAVELLLSNPGCRIAACGSCIYDFDFELSGLASVTELSVRVGFENCSSGETDFRDDVLLPIEGAASGSLCRFIPPGPLAWQAIKSSSCGTYNMPCGEQCDGTTGCDEELTCVELAADDHRCLETCSADADCSSPLTACRDGTCRPAATF